MNNHIFTAVLAAVMTIGAAQCTFAAVPPLPCETQEQYDYEISLPIDDVLVGDTVYVQIKINPKADIYAFEAVLNYDSQGLEYKKTLVNGTDSDGIIIENNKKSELLFAFSAIGETDCIGMTDKLCTVEFEVKRSGGHNISLSSLKTVFKDMTYLCGKSAVRTVTITVKEPEKKPPKKQHGGGGSGGGFSISGAPVTAVGAKKPDEPAILRNEDSLQPGNTDFVDVPADFWAFDAIHSLKERGIVTGIDDNEKSRFMPDNYITRAEFANIVTAAFSISAESTEASSEFVDVSAEDWFCSAVTAAAFAGIICGDGDGAFYPMRDITREEACAILTRCAEYLNTQISPVRANIEFSDESKISEFAQLCVDVLYMAGVVNGYEDGSFCPQSLITRAEAASLIYGFDKITAVHGGAE